MLIWTGPWQADAEFYRLATNLFGGVKLELEPTLPAE
jgi:hypothetical protein